MPPPLLMLSTQSWYPYSVAWPSAAKSPVKGSEAPMVMGPRWIGVGVLEVKEVDELQALKPTKVKTNAPTIYKILSMNGIK